MERWQVHLTRSEAETRCREWQKILRLDDWDVKLRIARGNGLDLPADIQGRCEWSLTRKEALIRILDPMDWDPTITWPQDMEASLVHELLHLHFAPFVAEEKTAADVAQEQAIHALAYALVGLRRGGALA